MTPNQKQRLERKIKKIRATLSAEKRKLCCFDDSRGLRYVPTGLYLKLQDYKGGLTYLRWFAKNFPNDAGFPEFLFESAIILFKNGRIKDAERKATEAFFRNTYIFDKFFGRAIQKIEKLENWNVEAPEFIDDLRYSYKQSELADFSDFLHSYEQTAIFQSIKDRYIKARIRLQDEHNPEMRHYLVRIDRELLKEV